MLYFVALVWNEQNPPVHARASDIKAAFKRIHPDWLEAAAAPGLAVFCTTGSSPCVDQVYSLPNSAGVVLGRLFERAVDRGYRCVSSISARETHTVAATGGRHLVENYWGRYVAFIVNDSHTKYVIRDPSGILSCLHTETDGVSVYFHRIQDVESVVQIRPAINRRYLVGRLSYKSICVPQTGIVGIQAVLPGQRVIHKEERSEREFLWNPVDVAGSPNVLDFRDAIHLTRETVRGCVDAWASCFDGILHRLSGGLDSNIVLSCLSTAPTKPHLAAVNESYTNGATSNDRLLAERASRRANCELIRWESDGKYRIPRPDRPPRSASPVLYCADSESHRRLATLARRDGYSAIFSGDGGDVVFYRGGRFPTSVDYAWLHGISPKLLRVALDDARYSNVSIWRILRRAITHKLQSAPWSVRELHPKSMGHLLSESTRRDAESAEDLWHPLFAGSPDLPPAKLDHAYLLTFSSAREFNPHAVPGIPVSVEPLMSQPLLELSLRTPVHVLRTGGRDRSAARAAFESEVPHDIIMRKKTLDAGPFFNSVLNANLDTFRDFLLDGFLVQSGYLDGDKLRSVLTDTATLHPTGVAELLHYMDVEAWSRSWTTADSAVPSQISASH